MNKIITIQQTRIHEFHDSGIHIQIRALLETMLLSWPSYTTSRDINLVAHSHLVDINLLVRSDYTENVSFHL